MIEHAASWPPGAEQHADVCVVGSGAAGLSIGRELDGTGLRVLLLEAGDEQRDEMIELDTFATMSIGRPFRSDIEARGRWLGGSMNLWFGRIALPDPIDLAPRPWVPLSGWPVGYDELAAHFPRAAELLGLAHADLLDIGNWPRNPTIDSFTIDGRPHVGVFLWAGDPGLDACRRVVRASSNVRLALGATATELIPTGDGRSIESLVIRRPDGTSHRVSAGSYVLAAGGLENPRLLLASTAGHPTGVGNGHDMVGRCYLDHPRAEGYGEVDLRPLSDAQVERVLLLGEKAHGPQGTVQLRVQFPPAMQQHERLLNHCLHAHLPTAAQLTAGYVGVRTLRDTLRGRRRPTARELGAVAAALGRSLPSMISAGVGRVRRGERPARLIAVDQMDQEPDRASRVTIDRAERDRFGMPRLVVDWRVSEATFRSQRRMHELVRERLAVYDIPFRSRLLDRTDVDVELLDMRHPSGTTRMSDDPTTGVVDRDGRVHGVDNLYVAGSSVFPTVGHFNPTFTIIALAVRLARHLADRRSDRPAPPSAASPDG